MQLAIEMELARLGATNPKKTVNPEAIRHSLEQVGMISGEIYLRRSLVQ